MTNNNYYIKALCKLNRRGKSKKHIFLPAHKSTTYVGVWLICGYLNTSRILIGEGNKLEVNTIFAGRRIEWRICDCLLLYRNPKERAAIKDESAVRYKRFQIEHHVTLYNTS